MRGGWVGVVAWEGSFFFWCAARPYEMAPRRNFVRCLHRDSDLHLRVSIASAMIQREQGSQSRTYAHAASPPGIAKAHLHAASFVLFA